MDELLVVAIEVEKVLGEIGKTPYEPLQEEREQKLALGETINDKVVPTLWRNNTIQCQPYKS